MPLTYSNYLKIPELLRLQQPLSQGPEHDETLFIIVHQVYELWFKALLHEIDGLNADLLANQAASAQHKLHRIGAIFTTLVSQLHILETMTPLQFLSFRDRLQSASGFQSFQFRELEFVLGKKKASHINQYDSDSAVAIQLHQRLHAPSLWDCFLTYLHRNGYAVPVSALQRDYSQPLAANPDVQQLLLRLYKQDDHKRALCEQLVDLDELFQQWRYSHMKMVERTIGFKTGTGNSAGVEYLKSTLFQPLFIDLWQIRSLF